MGYAYASFIILNFLCWRGYLNKDYTIFISYVVMMNFCCKKTFFMNNSFYVNRDTVLS